MISSVVVVPSAPALLPEYVGRVDPLGEVRASAVRALAAGVAGADRVVLVAASDREPRHTRGPLGERVGRSLLALAGVSGFEVVVVPWDTDVPVCRALGEALASGAAGAEAGAGTEAEPDAARLVRRTALVVVGDGSASRSEKAPGYLDERAAGFDAELVGALEAGRLGQLLALDASLAAELLAHGRAPLQVAAAAAAVGGDGAPWLVRTVEVDDTFGVLHVIAHLDTP